MNDFSGYTSSLNNTFSQMPQLTKSQQTAEDKIKDYNNRVNQIISPLGDEFVRQSSDIITGGIQKGLKLGFGKKLGSKLIKTTEDSSNSNGLLGGNFVNVDKIKPKAQPQKLLRNDTQQATNDFKLTPHSSTRTLGDINKSILSDEEKVQLNLERAQQASLRSGQILRQTGATPDAEVLARAKQKLADQQRPPPAKPAQEPDDDDDDDDFQDAEEEPNVEETNLDTGEKVLEKDTEKEVEKKTEKEGLKEGERFGEKFAEGEAEGGGPEDPASTILALGLGVASLFAQKKLQKKDITPPPPQEISPNFARGL